MAEDEKKGAQTEAPKDTGSNNQEGNISKALDPIDRAYEAAKRLEEQNKRYEENIRRMQDLTAKQILGGQTSAGKPEEKKEDDPRDYARKALKNEL